MDTKSIKKIEEIIKKNKSFLITSHISLEGDSIGSQLAMYSLLKRLGKNVKVIDDDLPAPLYSFLPYIKKITNNTSKKPRYDVTIVLDCPVIERTGKVARILNSHKPVINIDHHVSNTFFGDANWVDHNASSCAELVYELFHAFGKPITRKCALLLYVAILTDTGSFGYENTGAKTHRIVKELIETGLRPIDIHSRIYESKSLEELRLLQKVLSTLRITHSGKTAYLYVTRKILKESGCELGVTEGFINYARSIKGTKVALIFLENPYEHGAIQVSLRSKGEVNVNRLASRFGGGGHKNAAGCVVKGDLNKVMTMVLKTVKEFI